MSPVVHAVAFAAAAAVLCAVALVVWRRRRARTVTASSMGVVLVAAAWWSLADAVIVAQPVRPWAGIAALATFPAIGTMVAAFVCLGLSMNGSAWRPGRRLLLGLAVEPVLLTLVAATNPWHLAFYRGTGAAALVDPNSWQHGPLFWVHSVYSYLLLVIGAVLVARGWSRSPALFRGQRLSILLGSSVPASLCVLNLLGVTGDFGDPTPFGFAFTAVVVALAIGRQDVLRLAPVARDVLFATISDAVIALSPDGRIIDLNPAAERILRAVDPHLPPALVGLSSGEALAGWGASDVAVEIRGAATSETLVAHVVDGRRTELAVRRAALVDNRGRPLGTVLVARDVSATNAQHRELAEQLRTIEVLRQDLAEQANRDPLTELHNRRYVMERFGPMLSRSGPATPVSVLMIDIDRFKRINDRYGHQIGDGVLVAVARRLTAAVPPGALVSRWGGEEFVVVLPGTGVTDAIQVADRVRQRCEAEPFDVGHDAHQCTVSVGVSSFPADGLTVVDLLEASDRALYLAKRDGRNQVRSAVPDLADASEVTSRTAGGIG
ncbi:MAG TPA: diguanylate cyclase [Cellulomonadaceae bacterium]|nr:diguanylate cyclase [Cellulomonadaceae bacterium]